MRLHVFLARAGVASRRAAEKLIAEGRVKVNGKPVRVQGCKVDPAVDWISLDGKSVGRSAERKRYFLFHKPAGVVTTLSDAHAGKSVADFFRDVPEKLIPAGRLDKFSTGLLLMTNDGDLIYRLTHPRFEVPKGYRVTVRGSLPDEAIRCLERGVILYGKRTAPCTIQVLTRGKGAAEVRMTLREGRKREIREMVKQIGARVVKLHRESYGALRLGNLAVGGRRELSLREIQQL